ncbi:MAG: hypothetical protein HND46_08290 [Chloroflexi bacterium]|nr:hypothetical protein [Chloroflexota bacterium]NOG63406.1 hypothetical protein [Chloroflexota bacterium]
MKVQFLFLHLSMQGRPTSACITLMQAQYFICCIYLTLTNRRVMIQSWHMGNGDELSIARFILQSNLQVGCVRK